MTTSKCKSCGADIIFAVTDTGRTMPLDAQSSTMFVMDPQGALVGSPRCKSVQVRTSHFATCPQADAWRRSKEGTR